MHNNITILDKWRRGRGKYATNLLQQGLQTCMCKFDKVQKYERKGLLVFCVFQSCSMEFILCVMCYWTFQQCNSNTL